MICNEIQKLINYSIKSGLIEKEDEFRSIFGGHSKDYKGLYKKLAKYLHPDKPTGNEELFKAISILK